MFAPQSTFSYFPQTVVEDETLPFLPPIPPSTMWTDQEMFDFVDADIFGNQMLPLVAPQASVTPSPTSGQQIFDSETSRLLSSSSINQPSSVEDQLPSEASAPSLPSFPSAPLPSVPSFSGAEGAFDNEGFGLFCLPSAADLVTADLLPLFNVDEEFAFTAAELAELATLTPEMLLASPSSADSFPMPEFMTALETFPPVPAPAPAPASMSEAGPAPEHEAGTEAGSAEEDENAPIVVLVNPTETQVQRLSASQLEAQALDLPERGPLRDDQVPESLLALGRSLAQTAANPTYLWEGCVTPEAFYGTVAGYVDRFTMSDRLCLVFKNNNA